MSVNSWSKPSSIVVETQDEKEIDELNHNDPSVQTFIGYVHTDDEGDDDEAEGQQWSMFIPNEKIMKRQQIRRRRYKNLRKAVPPIVTWRSSLLAFYLCLTLGVFWLLDSIKDPILLATSGKDGDLQSQQPYAKMLSVLGTLLSTLFLEYYFTKSSASKQNSDNIPSHEDILDGGGVWTKMNTSTSYNQNNDNYNVENKDEEEGISVDIFTWLGIIYIGLLGFFAILIPTSTDNIWVGYGMYWVIESYGSLFIASFWSYANTTLSLEAAEHYFGYIVAVGQIGAILGSSLATSLFSSSENNIQSIPRIIIYSCCGIFISILEIRFYDYYYPKPLLQINHANSEEENDDDDDETESYVDSIKLKQGVNKPKVRTNNNAILEEQEHPSRNIIQPHKIWRSSFFGALPGITTIWKHTYLIYLLGASCLYEISLTCLDYQLKMIGLRSQINFGKWMGQYGFTTNVISLLFSFFLFPYVIRNYGLKTTIRLFPTFLLFITLLVYLALPLNLPVLFISMALLKGMTYSIHDPATELLYQPTSNFIKFKCKFWIDVVGDRIAKAMGSFMNARAGSAENIVSLGTIPSVLISIALLATSHQVGILFDTYISNNVIIGQNDVHDKHNTSINNEYDSQHGEEDYESEFYEFYSQSNKNENNENLWNTDISSHDEGDNNCTRKTLITSVELLQQSQTNK